MYRIFEPEVPGGLGDETDLDGAVYPPLVKKLHFEFEGWLGDDILESFPCYLVTGPLRRCIEEDGLTGIYFEDALITKSDNFIELYTDRELPAFYWAKIVGEFVKSDFFLAPDHRLVISEKSYRLLTKFSICNATIEQMP